MTKKRSKKQNQKQQPNRNTEKKRVQKVKKLGTGGELAIVQAIKQIDDMVANDNPPVVEHKPKPFNPQSCVDDILKKYLEK